MLVLNKWLDLDEGDSNSLPVSVGDLKSHTLKYEKKKQTINMQFNTFAFPVCVPKNILILSDLALLLLLASESTSDGGTVTALFPC